MYTLINYYKELCGRLVCSLFFKIAKILTIILIKYIIDILVITFYVII